MTQKLQPCRPFHFLKPAWVKLFVYIVTSWEYINSTLLIVNSKWNEVFLRSSFSNFQLLKMIINEQYDLAFIFFRKVCVSLSSPPEHDFFITNLNTLTLFINHAKRTLCHTSCANFDGPNYQVMELQMGARSNSRC